MDDAVAYLDKGDAEILDADVACGDRAAGTRNKIGGSGKQKGMDGFAAELARLRRRHEAAQLPAQYGGSTYREAAAEALSHPAVVRRPRESMMGLSRVAPVSSIRDRFLKAQELRR